MTPQETEPDLPVSFQESLAEARVDNGLLWGCGTEYNSPGATVCQHVLLKEATITAITPTIVWPEAKCWEETAPPITRKLD